MPPSAAAIFSVAPARSGCPPPSRNNPAQTPPALRSIPRPLAPTRGNFKARPALPRARPRPAANPPPRDRSCYAPPTPALPAAPLLVFRVDHPQHEVRLRRAPSRAPHPLLLHGIRRLPNSGGVDHRHRITVKIELNFDHVPRRAGMRRHDRNLAPRQLIDQGRFSDIRRARDRDHQSLPQAFTSSLRRKHFLNLIPQAI